MLEPLYVYLHLDKISFSILFTDWTVRFWILSITSDAIIGSINQVTTKQKESEFKHISKLDKLPFVAISHHLFKGRNESLNPSVLVPGKEIETIAERPGSSNTHFVQGTFWFNFLPNIQSWSIIQRIRIVNG